MAAAARGSLRLRLSADRQAQGKLSAHHERLEFRHFRINVLDAVEPVIFRTSVDAVLVTP